MVCTQIIQLPISLGYNLTKVLVYLHGEITIIVLFYGHVYLFQKTMHPYAWVIISANNSANLEIICPDDNPGLRIDAG